MDFAAIEAWLKSTILGIIILGAFGSIFAVIILYFLRKVSNLFIVFLKSILDKMVVVGVENILFKYLKFYLQFKGTLTQLKNRNKTLSIVIMHKRYISIRDTSYILSIIFFLISYFLLLFSGTEYLKTSVAFVSLTILSVHDAFLNAILVDKIEEQFLGNEEEFAKNTYLDKNTLIYEAILFSNNSSVK